MRPRWQSEDARGGDELLRKRNSRPVSRDRWAHDPREARKVRRAANKAYQLPRRRGLLNGEEEWRTSVRRVARPNALPPSLPDWKTHKFQFNRGSAYSDGFYGAKRLRLILIFAHFDIQPETRVSGDRKKKQKKKIIKHSVKESYLVSFCFSSGETRAIASIL